MVSQIYLQSGEADPYQVCLRSSTDLLDDANLDSSRYSGSPPKHMLQIFVERESDKENLHLVKLGVIGSTKDLGRMGY